MKNNKTPGIQVGSSSILVTFVLLCLITFATLSLVTVKGDERLSQSAGEKIKEYYEADGQAHKMIAQADIISERLSLSQPAKSDITSEVYAALPGELALYAQDNGIPADSIMISEEDGNLVLSFKIPGNGFCLNVKAQIMIANDCSLRIESLNCSPLEESDAGDNIEEPIEENHPKLLF